MPLDPPDLMRDPHLIYQDWLDCTSAALMADDVAGFVDHVALPFIFRTGTDETVLETDEDLRGDVSSVVQALKSQQVTHYIRLVKQARYLDETTIEGWHTTHVLRNATSVIPAYGNRLILRLLDGGWKVTEADHELTGSRFPLSLLRSDPGCFEERWADAKSNIRGYQTRAEPIYQVFLNSLDGVVNSPSFEGWCDLFTFPFSAHFFATDHTVAAPQDGRAFFDLIVTQLNNFGSARMRRSARYAEFLSEDRILGYHHTTITKDDDIVFGPIKSRMMLTFADGQWKCSSVTNSLSHETPSDPTVKVTDKLPTMREIQKRMRK
ncbi:hypothetical protein [Gymnodinialimonas sp. 57CJ19]|uniref:hypothetical protein n=1 Tax=Gymnodinialimonas sp. 57CJ19 TaxID=3138498 RepID=UPI0031342971